MKNYAVWLLALLTTISLSSCELIGDIFKAGMWFGIIIVAAIVILILWLIGKARR